MTGIIERIEVVDADMIEPMPIKIRNMKPEEMSLLRRSIAELGYVEPIQVCNYTEKVDFVEREPPFYLIVNGQHRYDVLVGELGADKVSVVVLGENWDKMRYWSEAIRLNNIRGRYDVVKLADRIMELRNSIPDWDELRERLGFTPEDKILKRVIKFLEYVGEDVVSDFKKKFKSGVADLDGLSKALGDVLATVGKGDKFIVFAYKSGDYIIFNCEDDLWSSILDLKRKIGSDGVYKKLRDVFISS